MKLALPTGDPREVVGRLLDQAGVAAPGYEASSRVLRSTDDSAGVTVRVFRERDIPVQVALGNYQLGICGDLWLTEQQIRFPLQHVVEVGSLPGPVTEVWVAAAADSGCIAGHLPADGVQGARIASEFPNLADLFALHARIPGYQLLPIHGSADAYPPEDAELVLVPGSRASVEAKGLVPLHRLFSGGLVLIANADALGTADMYGIVSRLAPHLAAGAAGVTLPGPRAGRLERRPARSPETVRLALPDGHAQRHTFAALRDAGMAFDGYGEKTYLRRPVTGIEGLEAKVIRPQDMPAMVALGAFDIAVTGRDLLHEHRCRFPGSPVEMAVDLGRSRYRIGPVVEQAFPAETTPEALAIWGRLGRPVRIASEFPALAEAFARDSHILHTEIMPIAGASEGFVPEDADVLIEGSETGASIRANGLKMLDPFMESTNCVIVRSTPVTRRSDVLGELVARLQRAAEMAKE